MLKTLKELEDIRKKTFLKMKEKQILVCSGTGCTSCNSENILQAFNEEINKKNISNIVAKKAGCFGYCAKGPIVVVKPENIFYEKVSVDDVFDIVDAIEKNSYVERLLIKEEEQIKKKYGESNFYKKQVKVALKNCGVVNPESIDEYLAMDGYKALEKVVFDLKKEDIIEELEKSGLRGRGGAGFLTAKKWAFTKNAVGNKKYVVCNADEGDPGAFMDESILEGDPFSVIEAMSIAGYVIGADTGYIYVRAEYPLSVKRLNIAIEQANEYNLLGNNILGSDFNFNLELRLGAGAFVCGEETALIESIKGKRGQPRTKPPFPAIKGLFGKPTLINNVETYANIPQIILKGSKWFSSIGIKTSTGTKVFSLGGDIENVGLVEVPMGTKLKEVIYDIGGGVTNGHKFKAAQTGGPSGGCIPASLIDTPLDYESLNKIGSMMGSGGLIVMDDTKCMVSIAKFFLEFTVEESCGKCAPCRIGTKRMLEILEQITNGLATLEDLDTLEELAMSVKKNSLCGLGQAAPNPVLSTLRYFKDEYIEHIVDKKCRAGVCKNLVHVTIDKDLCKMCGICQKNCPSGAISGELGKTPYIIDQNKCTKCLICVDKCPFNAISK